MRQLDREMEKKEKRNKQTVIIPKYKGCVNESKSEGEREKVRKSLSAINMG